MLRRSYSLIVLSVAFFTLSAASMAQSAPLQDDQVPLDYLSNQHGDTTTQPPHPHQNVNGHTRQGIFGIDSIPNFSGHYFANGVDANGNPQNKWLWNMVGNPPQQPGTTTINAPIVPVSLDLRNADGSPRFVNGQRLFYDVTPFIQPTFNSPVFQNSTYTSSPVPTQFADAVQRAEFADQAKPDWHTILNPSVKTTRVMTLLKGTYQFALNPDGSCCAFVLVDRKTFSSKLFPTTSTDTTTPVGAAENAGEVTTKDISTFLFPNTFLFSGTACCTLGFHTYDFEPGDDSNGNVEKRFVLNYSSWISPGLFGTAFEDVTANSHEIVETFNDPFVASDGVHNITPWWLAPNSNCQHSLETGDVIEGLSNATIPIAINGVLYHPQNEALLQWFEFQVPSNALDGAYSYPDENVLTGPSQPQNAFCK